MDAAEVKEQKVKGDTCVLHSACKPIPDKRPDREEILGKQQRVKLLNRRSTSTCTHTLFIVPELPIALVT